MTITGCFSGQLGCSTLRQTHSHERVESRLCLSRSPVKKLLHRDQGGTQQAMLGFHTFALAASSYAQLAGPRGPTASLQRPDPSCCRSLPARGVVFRGLG